jgi:hypothetical protein
MLDTTWEELMNTHWLAACKYLAGICGKEWNFMCKV